MERNSMKLFEPGKIGGLKVKNRIMMAAMNTNLHELDGRFSERAIDFYVARAKGGVGLIISSYCAVERRIEPKAEGEHRYLPMADRFTYINRLSQLADAVHDYGAKIAIQLTAGVGRVLPVHFIEAMKPLQPVAPSAQPCFSNPNVTARALTLEELGELVAAFGFAAKLLVSAGVDAIELHGHAGYLIDQFMTSIWNRRKDRYGGDLEGRLRFPLEIIEAIKSSAGRDFPLIFKHAVKHYINGGRDVEESLEIAKRLEKAGVDAIDVSAGCFGSPQGREHPMYSPPGQWVELAEAIKKTVRIPVIVGGALGHPGLAERVLEEKKADFISLGRGLLADPEWPNKVREGRLEDILICIQDNEGCLGRTRKHKYVSCTLNPTTGMERDFGKVIPAKKRKSVLVVGGGPAGMEVARVAAVRGHEVTLWEKGNELGGNLIPASIPEFKMDIKNLIKYWSSQIKKLGVRVELCKEATCDLIRKAKPDVLVIATGASPLFPPIPGIERNVVVSAVDLLLGKKMSGETVIVAGGGLIGCEIGLYLAEKGKKVTILEMTKHLASDVFEGNRSNIISMLENFGVTLLTETTLLEILDDGVIVNDTAGKKTLKADTVVLALGLRSEIGLLMSEEVKELSPICIGDCLEPRKIINAVWEGFRVGRLI
jgi:2-enoate reductase